MSQPLPDDFPELDMEAWRAAMPFPDEPDEPDGLDELIAFALESAEATPPAPATEESDDEQLSLPW